MAFLDVKQLHSLVNTATTEVLGESGLVQEDLSNLVDIGEAIVNTEKVDAYVRKLVHHIGKVAFNNRLYVGGAPSVLMDSWEFGSILERISAEMPEATENESWQLEDGKSYDPNVFHQPKINVSFFDSKVTFEIQMSFTDRQVKSSFSSAEQLSSFINMLTVAVQNSLTIKMDSLVMRTIYSMIGETINADLRDGEKLNDQRSTVRAVNLLKLYNATATTKLNFDNCMSNPDFIRFATYTISTYSDRMSKISTLFNIKGSAKFTPIDQQKLVLLSDFARASETYLISGTINPDRVTLPKHDSIPYWQGSGKDYSLTDVSAINVVTSSNKAQVAMRGIIGALFDSYALGVANLDQRVTTNYNPRAEFYTNFYKVDAGFFNDLAENFVVFFIA